MEGSWLQGDGALENQTAILYMDLNNMPDLSKWYIVWLYLALSLFSAALTFNHHKSPIPELNIIASASEVVYTARQSDSRRWSVICYRRPRILIRRRFRGVGVIRLLHCRLRLVIRWWCRLTSCGSLGTVVMRTRCRRIQGRYRGSIGSNLGNISIILVMLPNHKVWKSAICFMWAIHNKLKPKF